MSISKNSAETVVTLNEVETLAWGRTFAARLRPGDVVALTGDLGAGKTCLAKGIAAGLGVTASVTSPTFTLIHEYTGRVPVTHIDLYRLNSVSEALAIGVTDYLGGNTVCLVEWPEKIADLLPPEAWRITLEVVDTNSRRITVTEHR